MASSESLTPNPNPLVQQIVSSIDELDNDQAIENALSWLCRECGAQRAMFYQFRDSMLLTLVTFNVEDTWSPAYRRLRLFTQDPLIKYYRAQLGFVEWHKAFELHPSPDNFRQAIEDHQLLPGFSYGYTSHGRSFQGVTSICSLNGLRRTLTPGDKYLLSSLVPVLHLVGRGTKLRSKGLSSKELEVLEWARDGKTAWEIASIRQISEATVKYHLKSIYSKLGVSNRAQAVGEALCLGIIK